MNFNFLSLSEKFYFFDCEVNEIIDSSENIDFNVFFSKIILDDSENSNIRKRALEIFIECVFLKKIKTRQALNLLVDNWNNNCDVFLKLQRLKDLFFFYDQESSEIETIFKDHLKEEETELISEAYFNLGLINMQKGFLSLTKHETLSYLKESEIFFRFSNEFIENRIDAQFYIIIVSILTDSMNSLKGNFQQSLKMAANILFNKEAFSNIHPNNPFYLGFYRVLNSVYLIEQENPENWLDYRISLTQLYNQYSEINNQILKERLNRSILSSTFNSLVGNQFIEPYFSLNFNSQISKIDTRLFELDSKSEEFIFLNYLKESASNQDFNKKAASDSIRQSLKNLFPQRSYTSIDETLLKIKNDRSTLDFLNVIEELKAPSIKEFTDKLINACIKLQGNRIYRGNYSEDDRNTFIASILEASDYSTKDQTRWSTSAAGKSAGEIDIFIYDKKGYPFTIIEALNLASLKTDYTILHINKIFTYDTSGLECNFILVYSLAKKFNEFWTKYTMFISKHTYQYQFLSFEEINDYPYTDIKIGKAKHLRNGKEVLLYHIVVDLL
ncbi:hypothetical protein [Flavobacterium sp. LB2R40]|uniref:hypothetical protein n=1 Tax=Flavobacterium sp. LB2R40 TaxID=3401722 RepID=UPI003AAE5292